MQPQAARTRPLDMVRNKVEQSTVCPQKRAKTANKQQTVMLLVQAHHSNESTVPITDTLPIIVAKKTLSTA